MFCGEKHFRKQSLQLANEKDQATAAHWKTKKTRLSTKTPSTRAWETNEFWILTANCISIQPAEVWENEKPLHESNPGKSKLDETAGFLGISRLGEAAGKSPPKEKR